jgi:hypothetical protein
MKLHVDFDVHLQTVQGQSRTIPYTELQKMVEGKTDPEGIPPEYVMVTPELFVQLVGDLKPE